MKDSRTMHQRKPLKVFCHLGPKYIDIGFHMKSAKLKFDVSQTMDCFSKAKTTFTKSKLMLIPLPVSQAMRC